MPFAIAIENGSYYLVFNVCICFIKSNYFFEESLKHMDLNKRIHRWNWRTIDW